MVPLIIGLVIGGVLGFGACLAFKWALFMDADRRYKAADERWKAGTEEYQKAVRALEIAREEKAEYVGNAKRRFNAIIDVLRRNPALAAEVAEIEKIVS